MKRTIVFVLTLLVSVLVFTPAYGAIVGGTGTTLQEPVYAVVHYSREQSDYGDHTTGDYNDFWGLHLWEDVEEPTGWVAPRPFLGEDEYGRFSWVKLAAGATDVGFIVHRGDIKDGTDLDRFFDPGVTPEIWLRNDDATVYTSQVEAQGFITIHYKRDDGDYGDPSSPDFNDFWGVHLWGDAIDSSETTKWMMPKKPTGFDDYGAFWDVQVVDISQALNFIIHRGNLKDTGPDQSFVPMENVTIWLQSGDETIYPQRGAAENIAVLHYHRDDGDYGDPASPDFNDYWGLHVWTGALSPGTPWEDPLRPYDIDIFGPVFMADLEDGANELAYILHRGDEKDPGPDQFLEFGAYGYEVWQLEDAEPGRPYILPVLTMLTVPEAIDEIVIEVEGLIATGQLNKGQGNALLKKLHNTLRKLEQGKIPAAVSKLQAFIDQVNSFISEGILAPAEGQALIDAVDEIIVAILGWE